MRKPFLPMLDSSGFGVPASAGGAVEVNALGLERAVGPAGRGGDILGLRPRLGWEGPLALGLAGSSFRARLLRNPPPSLRPG